MERFPTAELICGAVAPLAAVWYDLADPGAFALLPVMIVSLTVAPFAAILAIARVFKTRRKIACALLAVSSLVNVGLCAFVATSLFG